MNGVLPAIALAVRQPWAWAIIHGGKDIENRTIDSIAKGGMGPRRIAILASLGMTRDEYESAANFINATLRIPPTRYCPPACELLRGGIIGIVTVTEIVSHSKSEWFIDQRRGRGLVLADPQPCDFIPAAGQLGYFHWRETRDGEPAPAARWMLPELGGARRTAPMRAPEPDLFE